MMFRERDKEEQEEEEEEEEELRETSWVYFILMRKKRRKIGEEIPWQTPAGQPSLNFVLFLLSQYIIQVCRLMAAFVALQSSQRCKRKKARKWAVKKRLAFEKKMSKT